MGAKRLVLTHFSSRYFQPWNDVEKVATLEEMLEEAKKECPDAQVYTANDFWFIDVPKTK